ncbi:MAG: glycosyltransferase family 2 protein [Anaerocolumna sp.]
MEEICVSIIIPVYNVEKYVLRCLESLRMQTLDSIEVIIINDGSKDKSGEICKKYIEDYKLDSKFFYHYKENGGLSDARNFGIQFARGKYICFLDSDDFVEHKTYEMLYLAAVENNAFLVECEFWYSYDTKETIERLPNKYTSINEFFVKSSVVAWNKLINRDFLLRYNVSFPKGWLYEDLNFFFKLYSQITDISKIVTVNKPLIHYVQRENSISYSSQVRVKEIIYIYTDVINTLKVEERYDCFSQEIEYKMVRNLLCSFMKKVMQIDEKAKRIEMVTLFWDSIDTFFPKWRKNKYLKAISIQNIYIKLSNRKITKILCKLL